MIGEQYFTCLQRAWAFENTGYRLHETTAYTYYTATSSDTSCGRKESLQFHWGHSVPIIICNLWSMPGLSGVYPKKDYINQQCFLQQCLCIALTPQALHSSSNIAGCWSCGPGPTLNLQGRMAETASFPVGLWHLALSSVHRLSTIS